MWGGHRKITISHFLPLHLMSSESLATPVFHPLPYLWLKLETTDRVSLSPNTGPKNHMPSIYPAEQDFAFFLFLKSICKIHQVWKNVTIFSDTLNFWIIIQWSKFALASRHALSKKNRKIIIGQSSNFVWWCLRHLP